MICVLRCLFPIHCSWKLPGMIKSQDCITNLKSLSTLIYKSRFAPSNLRAKSLFSMALVAFSIQWSHTLLTRNRDSNFFSLRVLFIICNVLDFFFLAFLFFVLFIFWNTYLVPDKSWWLRVTWDFPIQGSALSDFARSQASIVLPIEIPGCGPRESVFFSLLSQSCFLDFTVV